MPSMTITYTAAEGQRISSAFGKKLSLGEDATAAQVKADVILFVRHVVKDQERLALVNPNPDVDPT